MASDVAAAVFDLEARPASHRLDRTLVHGITWTGGIKGVTLLLSWASTVIVARLLSPADYGLVAMATVYIGLTTMITDFGLGSAIVAMREVDDELVAQLHSVAAMIGAGALLISCLLAVPLSRFFKAPALAPVIVVLSTALVLDSLRTVPAAMLSRALRFKYLSLLEGGKVIVAVACTMTLATLGAAHWALVLGNVLASLVLTLVVMTILPQRAAWPALAKIKSALRFSSNFFIGQLAWYGYSNADFVVAGRILGATPLGQYTLAWTLTSAPADKIMAVFGRVMPTMLAAAQRDVAALRRYFLLFTEALALLIVPASVGLALVAPDFVLLVFGAKWGAAIAPLQILCIYTAIHIVGTPVAPLLQVTGHAHVPARCGVLTLIILPPAFFFCGMRWGTLGIASVWLLLYPLVLVPVFAKTFHTLDMTLREYIVCLTPTLVSAAAMTTAVYAIRSYADMLLPARFAAEVIGGAVVFIASALLLQQRRIGALAEFLRSVRS